MHKFICRKLSILFLVYSPVHEKKIMAAKSYSNVGYSYNFKVLCELVIVSKFYIYTICPQIIIFDIASQ